MPAQKLARETGQRPVASSAAATVSVTGFDARLVDQLGLADVAAHVGDVARRAGLNPPATFGSEVTARFIGLRVNHPANEEKLELYPWDPITRAEAAHSFAVLAGSGNWAVGDARARLSAFDLPAYGAGARRALGLVASKVGMPYIWGGESDGTSSAFGPQVHGGYGTAHFHSRATEGNIVHVGIALSDHWMIHSSAQGVYVSSLDEDWRRGEFAWARRVL